MLKAFTFQLFIYMCKETSASGSTFFLFLHGYVELFLGLFDLRNMKRKMVDKAKDSPDCRRQKKYNLEL